MMIMLRHLNVIIIIGGKYLWIIIKGNIITILAANSREL